MVSAIFKMATKNKNSQNYFRPYLGLTDSYRLDSGVYTQVFQVMEANANDNNNIGSLG